MKIEASDCRQVKIIHIIFLFICIFLFAYFYKEHRCVQNLETANKELSEKVSDLESQIEEVSSRVDDLEYY